MFFFFFFACQRTILLSINIRIPILQRPADLFLFLQPQQVIPRADNDDRDGHGMPDVLAAVGEVVVAHALHGLAREPGVVRDEGDEHLGDDDAVQRGQLPREDGFARARVHVREEMRAVLPAQVVQGVGDAADDGGDGLQGRGGADGEHGDVVGAVQARVHDAPFVVGEEFTPEGFFGPEGAGDAVAHAAAEVEEGLQGAAGCVRGERG